MFESKSTEGERKSERESSPWLSIVNSTFALPPTLPPSSQPYLVSATVAFLPESQFKMSLFTFGLIRIGQTDCGGGVELEEANLITSPLPSSGWGFHRGIGFGPLPVMHPLSFGRHYSGDRSIFVTYEECSLILIIGCSFWWEKTENRN